MTTRNVRRGTLSSVGLLAALLTTPAHAQQAPSAEVLISPDLITVTEATTLAQAALAACRAIGLPTNVRVVDAEGHPRVAMSDDKASVPGLDSSSQKLAAVTDFRVSTADLANRVKDDPKFAGQYGKDTRYRFSPGAFPLWRGDRMVGILALGGSRNRDADCATEALKSVPSLAFIPKASPPKPVAAGATFVGTAVFPAKRQLKVSSPAFADGGDVPFENTGWRANTFPGLSWTKGPAGTKSYVALLQDADGLMGGNDAILHWTMYNIPANVTSLPAGMTAPPPGAAAGPNRNGPSLGYLGPRTGAGAKHRYPFQVFALNTVIKADPKLSWVDLKAAMRGHVLASGQTVGLGQLDWTAPQGPPPSAPPAR